MNSSRFYGPSQFKILILTVTMSWLALLTRAQSLYSVNALGYADMHLAAGSNLVANPFRARHKSVSTLFRGLLDGSFFLPWIGPMGNFSPTNFCTQAGGWSDPG